MGFEQLAGLKEKLSKPAETRAPTKAPARPNRIAAPATIATAKPAVNTKPVDPVVVTIGRLQKRFPAAFPKNPAPKIPLKIGIFDDLISHMAELKLSETELRDAIKIWCRGSRYWTALVNNAIRVDLSGAEAGRVSPADADRAQKFEQTRLARAAAKAPAPKTTS
jgi:ProP effector